MSRLDVLHPNGNDFDPFLFADVGKDRAETVVTLLSALARLGLDPWKEAAELAILGPAVAQDRLESHLSRFKDVPALRIESRIVAARLTLLLPKRASQHVPKLSEAVEYSAPKSSTGWILAALLGVLVLARLYLLAQSG